MLHGLECSSMETNARIRYRLRAFRHLFPAGIGYRAR